jgi:hypothetical protein
LVRVLVRTSSLLEGWSDIRSARRQAGKTTRRNSQATTMTRVLRVQPSEAQAKLPESRRSARYLWLPPRVRTVWIRLAPIRVFAGWRPASKALFFPVRSCQKWFISMRVEQAQNAWGRLLGQTALSLREEQNRPPQEPPKRTFECPRCRGALYSI